MDPVTLARIQFGLTAAFHFLYPPVSIGLAWLVVYMAWRSLRDEDPIWDQMTKFWVRVLALVFAVGVATGITLEFQFGTNWAAYSRFVGDIFGAPLAAEGVFAFFLESTFMGVLIFGRNRVSRRFYAISALMVAVGSTLSAFWIIVANSWQQTPVAYRIVGEGPFRRAELTDFWAAVFNPSTLPRYLHTVSAAILTGAFLVAGASAHYLLKGRHRDFARRSLQVGLVAAAIFSLVVPGVGHFHSVQVARTQPAKLAAFEALFETERGAALVLWGFPDVSARTLRLEISLPRMLSFLLDFDPNSSVAGLDQFAEEDWPPIAAAFYPYHLMVLLGGWFVLLSWAGLLMGERRYTTRPFLWALYGSTVLPLLTMELGWLAAEFGRQPWVVYGLLRTEDAVSPVVPASHILATILLFALIYTLLLALLVYLLKREFERGPEEVAK
ncbi:MAG TPA: cytochrome ubiquinol oxidase subunit I [Chloroflexi bacterium]|nr:cytochrome ubiquinol oxidase subunit I [Chloroflexota bacterium]